MRVRLAFRASGATGAADMAITMGSQVERGRAKWRTPTTDALAMLGGLLLTVALALWAVVGVDADGWAKRDNDDRLRMVQVRDWMSGQSWDDLDQHRLGPPAPVDGVGAVPNEGGSLTHYAVAEGGGTRLHWSRLVDLPIAGLIGLGRAFGHAEPERLAAFAAPLLPLPLLVFGSVIAALAGARLAKVREAGAAALAALVLVGGDTLVSNRFEPYALDHHNWQAALLAVAIAGMLVAILRHERGEGATAPALIAGGALALMPAIGMETLPYLATMAAGMALAWALDRERMRAHPALPFGIGFAVVSTLGILVFVPQARWWPATCDALTMGHLAPTLAAGALLAVSAWLLRARAMVARLAALGGIGIVATAAGWPVLAACAEGLFPFADERVRTLWLDHVAEAQPLLVRMADGKLWLAFIGAPMVGLLAAFWLVARRDLRFVVLLAPMAIGVMLVFWQIRASAFANVIACVPIAILVARMGEGRLPLRLAGMVVWLAGLQLSWGLGEVIASGEIGDAATESAASCERQADFAPLAALDGAFLMTGSNLGTYVLLHTPHRVMSAPYHRNVAGFTAVFDTFSTDLPTARATLAAHGITHVLVCDGGTETAVLANAAPQGLAAALREGRVPDWLVPVEGGAGGDLRLYAVQP